MRVRVRGSLLRDIKSGFSYGASVPVTGQAQPIPDPIPNMGAGPEDIRSGAIGGAHFYQVRNVIQIPFDDSIDGSYPLECFFQMPVNVKKISKAQVWVQRKPFRMYASAASSAGSSSGAGGTHTHNMSGNIIGGGGTTGSEAAHTHVPAGMGNQSALHTHVEGDGPTTGTESSNHSHSQSATGGGSSHSHSYTLHTPAGSTDADFPVHTHTITTTVTTTLTAGIFESGPSGNVSLYLADDGVTYGALISGPATALTAVDVTAQLTTTSGDKRLKVTATGLMRVQVLLVLDLLVAVDPLSIGIP